MNEDDDFKFEFKILDEDWVDFNGIKIPPEVWEKMNNVIISGKPKTNQQIYDELIRYMQKSDSWHLVSGYRKPDHKIQPDPNDEPFLAEYDNHGNLIRKQQNSFGDIESEMQRRLREAQELLERKDNDDVWIEFNGDTGQLEEKKEHNPEVDEPVWTEVRGSASFYNICPICGGMVPGIGPSVKGVDGIDRQPKQLHENWHRTVLCDWYQND